MNVLNTTQWLSDTSTRKICLTTVCFIAFQLLLFVYYPRNAKVQFHSQPLIEKVGPTKEQTTTGKNATDHTHESSSALRKPNDGIFLGTNKTNGHLRKAILLYDEVPFFPDKEVADKEACGYCPFIRDKKKLIDAETSAVLFYVHRLHSTPPPKDPLRRPDQLYLWWSLESQGNTVIYGGPKGFEANYLNGTMTFRQDSLFVLPGYLPVSINPVQAVKVAWNEVEIDVTRLLKNKTKHGVAIISNCVVGSLARTRIKVVHEIRKNGYPIDGFGQCFSKELPDHFQSTPRFLRTLKPYKFLFAFENSLHCRDYITEKFFINGLVAGAVPVVLGPKKASYEAVAPRNSFIHAEDFRSLSDLVKYLNYLDKNESAYAEYFAWRKAPVESSYPYGKYLGFCALCRALYGIPLDDKRSFNDIYGQNGVNYVPSIPLPFGKPQTVENLRKWWQQDETEECMNQNKAEALKLWNDMDPVQKT